MSYILDALRKSDQQRQRQRGAVPTLETLPVRAAPPRRPTPGSSLPLGAALLLAGVALGWWRPWEQPSPAAPPAALTSPPAAPASPPPPFTAPPVVSLPAVAAPATPTPTPLTSKTVPSQAPAPVTLPVPTRASPSVAPRPSVTVDVAPELESLPAAMRQALPPLEISFLIDAAAPLERRAMIDNTMLRPGESFGPGIFLEGISGDGVTLVYQGHRFRKRVHQ